MLHEDNLLRQVLDRVPFAVLLVAEDGRIVLANARVQALLGRRRSDLDCADLSHFDLDQR